MALLGDLTTLRHRQTQALDQTSQDGKGRLSRHSIGGECAFDITTRGSQIADDDAGAFELKRNT